MSTVAGLKQALPYLRLYSGKVFVIKLGGEIVAEEETLDQLATQVSLLHQLNIHMVVVHGGGPQATELARNLGIRVEVVNGRRVTDARTLDVAKMVFNGKLNTDILAGLSRHQVPAVGLSGVDSGLISAVRRPVQNIVDRETGKQRKVNFGFVGDVESVNPAVVNYLIAGSYVPVVSAMAGGEGGHVYNVNADTVAAEIAIALEATKLIFLTPIVGVLRDPIDPESLISQIKLDELDDFLSGSVKGGMSVKLEACRRAIEGGVPRAHIISGLDRDTLLSEIFTNEGCGTLVEA